MGRTSALAAAGVQAAAAWRTAFRKGMAGAEPGAAWLRQRWFPVALALAFAVRQGAKAFSTIVGESWATWMIWPAVGMSSAALGFEAHDVWQRLINAPMIESPAGSPPAGGKIMSTSDDGEAINESPEENTRMNHWKSAVEEALRDAKAKQKEGATGPELAGSAENKPREDEATAKPRVIQKQESDAGKEFNPFTASPVIDDQQRAGDKHPATAAQAQEAQKQEPDAGQGEDAGKELNPFAAGPLIDGQYPDWNAGPSNVVPFVRPDGTPFWRMRAQFRGRRHGRGRHFGWGIFRFRFIGR